MRRLTACAGAVFFAAGVASAANAADTIEIVGSSTVFPFTSAVIADFTASTNHRVVGRPTGTGGGFSAFCTDGPASPDITGASRRMKPAEFDMCRINGVDEIVELRIGRDGIVFANAKAGPAIEITRETLFQALGAQTIVDGALTDNPYGNWQQIDASLPAGAITVFGPPETSGTRDAFQSLALKTGCQSLHEAADLDVDATKADCEALRRDQAFIELGEDDEELLDRLRADQTAFGIVGFSYAYANRDIRANPIEGIDATVDTIGDGSYPLSRPLYLYVRADRFTLKPGLLQFLGVYLDEEAIGPEGYLTDLGLVALPDDQRLEMRSRFAEGRVLDIERFLFRGELATQ